MSQKEMNPEKIITIIMTCLIVGLILYLVFYWFGGQREIDNAKTQLDRWTQEAIVIEKTNHWWGDSCLLDAEDGKRYYEDSCYKYVNGDKVIIMMYKEYYSWIEELKP